MPAHRSRRAPAALGVAPGGYLVLRWLGRTWGSTAAECRRALPGDAIVRTPTFVTDHAVTIDARPDEVWPWLVQMGWHRGGWYTARWVDRLLFPANAPSADRIVPELQDLSVGDFVPDGPPESGTGFVVEALEPPHHLVLHSTTHLPPGWAERFGARMDWSWTFALDPVAGGGTRFQFRSRGRFTPWWVSVLYDLVIVPADFVMGRQMLRGLRTRAGTPGVAR